MRITVYAFKHVQSKTVLYAKLWTLLNVPGVQMVLHGQDCLTEARYAQKMSVFHQ